jgi:choline transport protein
VVLSLAELASSAPTAGGQYHWVSEYAPAKWQKLLSYCSGWLAMVSWQSMVVIKCYAISDIIQAMILVIEPTYVATRWRGTLLTMAAALVVTTFNIVLASHLSWCEGVSATVHFFAFVPVLVGLFIMAPKPTATEVFLHITQTNGGWPDTSLALFVGQVSDLFVMLGSDRVAHLAEEIEDAGVVLPQSMLWSYYVNAPLTLLMALVYCFSITSIPRVLASPMPFVLVFQDAFQGTDATIAFTAVVLCLIVVVAVSSLAATSRLIYAFA